MKDFNSFYQELISEFRWYELCGMHYREETIQATAHKVYAQLVADVSLAARPMSENRKHVYNKLVLLPGDRKKLNWVEAALKKEAKEKQVEVFQPASDEHVAKCVAEFDEMMRNSCMMNKVPKIPLKQQIEEGGWLPKKDAPYPITSPMEAYVKERHFQYIKQNYEPRTAEKLPGWIPEDEFNITYDMEHLDNVGL